MLKIDEKQGLILLDSETTLSGVPDIAWQYKLGSRCAVEWVLEMYRERTPRDATIRNRFNAYQFSDYKDRVIDLLRRVVTVSVETMAIVEEMRRLEKR